MARFSASQADNYGGQGGAGFFSLKGDGDVARVRFMYKTIDDVEGRAVHQVEINGKKRYVDCLREYNEPLTKCPFCREHMMVQAKLFIPVYDVDEDTVKIWERGKQFFNKISGLCSRYKCLVEKEFEIERHGKPGDTNTTYEIFPMDDSEKIDLEDLPEIPENYNNFVLEKSAEDMEYYLEEGQFPPEESEEPRRRRDSSNSSKRNNTRSRRQEPEDEDDVSENIDDEIPFEEEAPRSRRNNRSSGRQNTRRTPSRSRRNNDEDEY